VRLFNREGLQVHHCQYAVHRNAGPVAGLHIVVMFDDVRSLAHAHKFGVVRPFDLRRSHADEAL
jgi:hypothetical protein